MWGKHFSVAGMIEGAKPMGMAVAAIGILTDFGPQCGNLGRRTAKGSWLRMQARTNFMQARHGRADHTADDDLVWLGFNQTRCIANTVKHSCHLKMGCVFGLEEIERKERSNGSLCGVRSK